MLISGGPPMHRSFGYDSYGATSAFSGSQRGFGGMNMEQMHIQQRLAEQQNMITCVTSISSPRVITIRFQCLATTVGESW